MRLGMLGDQDAQSGLPIIESGMPIDVLFTDVVMPRRLRSPELARQLRERLSEIAVLSTSGYTDNAIIDCGRIDPRVELLSKPYTRKALARGCAMFRPIAPSASPRPRPRP